MKKIVFVSGCYDIIHGGHIEFFTQAKALGDYLVVSMAGADVLMALKGRRSSIPDVHKKRVIEAIDVVDEVVVSSLTDKPEFDFLEHFNRIRPDVLVSTADDRHADEKRVLCEKTAWGCRYVQLSKTLNFEAISTTDIVNWIKAPKEAPLRVDFGGGWLDVPDYSIPGSFIVNCTITPKVSLQDWRYEIGGGLGGSAAYAILSGSDGVKSELNLGVGWQDPAAIYETGLCVWRSGVSPALELKVNPDFMSGKMALLWTGKDHNTPSVASRERDYSLIKTAGEIAKMGVEARNINTIAMGANLSYRCQMGEGMHPLPDATGSLAMKYVGGGWGGYALYLFPNAESRDAFVKEMAPNAIPIEPFIREVWHGN